MTKKKPNTPPKPHRRQTSTNPSLGPLRQLVQELLQQYEQFDRDNKVNPGNQKFYDAAHSLLQEFDGKLSQPNVFCVQPLMDLPD